MAFPQHATYVIDVLTRLYRKFTCVRKLRLPNVTLFEFVKVVCVCALVYVCVGEITQKLAVNLALGMSRTKTVFGDVEKI